MAKYSIIAGPAKFDFATRYFDRELQNLKPFRFKLRQEEDPRVEFDVEVILSGITFPFDGELFQNYKGTSETWNLSGFVKETKVKGGLVGMTFKAFYQTTSRSGWLSPNL